VLLVFPIEHHRYVQATAFKAPYRESFGYPLMYNISGTLHTHVLAWKVDLDVGGTQNSVNIHHMKVRLTALPEPAEASCFCWCSATALVGSAMQASAVLQSDVLAL
jgi:Cu2+-containing amine oxidase